LPELFHSGVCRIVYKAKNFATGKIVTAYIWSPTLIKSSLQSFTELERGIYYLDYNFPNEGTYIGLFLENATPTTVGIFRVIKSLEIIEDVVVKLLQVETGRWKIINNQLIMYNEDGETILYKFDLKGKLGQPTERDVFERVPV